MVRCALCLRPVRRRWWQVGPFAPLPVCGPDDAQPCRERSRRIVR